MTQLDDVLARLGAMPEADKAKLVELASQTWIGGFIVWPALGTMAPRNLGRFAA